MHVEQSPIDFLKVVELSRIFQALQEPENIPQMRQLGLDALHPADQNVRDRTLSVKPETEVAVNLPESPVPIIVPNQLEVIELL